jgi:hypothetical protein
LAAGRVPVTVAGYSLVDVVIVNLRVEHGFDTGFETELGVVNFSSRLDELGHAYAEDVAWFVTFDYHRGGRNLKSGKE